MATGGGVKKNTLGPNLKMIAARYTVIVGMGLMVETEIETTEVRKRTPIDLGPLRASVHAEGPFFRPSGSIYSTIVAGGPAAAYAIFVHEDPDALHDPPTQWKFIESVIMEARAYFADRVAKRIGLERAASGLAR